MLEDAGASVSPGEYLFNALSEGIPDNHKPPVYVINANDLNAVKYVLSHHHVACILLGRYCTVTGIVKPVQRAPLKIQKLIFFFGIKRVRHVFAGVLWLSNRHITAAISR
jgi:glutamate-1-semialdehyde aminotransferase